MMTKYLTELSTKFNPFLRSAKTCRVVLASLPPDARSNIKLKVTVLPRSSQEKSDIRLKFKDGKEMTLNPEELSLKDVVEEIDRHSRGLRRQAELTGN